jgi:hypothetical protein
VKGSGIAKVTFRLDGHKVSSKTVHRGTSYKARVPVSPGRHHLTVTVTFRRATQTNPRTFHRTVTGCPVIAPGFTG